MSEQNEPSQSTDKGKVRLPPIGHAVWVKCEGHRTLAYRDSEGVWRALADGKEVTGIVKVEWSE